jgi:hypothetical protein
MDSVAQCPPFGIAALPPEKPLTSTTEVIATLLEKPQGRKAGPALHKLSPVDGLQKRGIILLII